MRNERNWMATYSGLKFYILKPDPKKIRIEDIAHHLALINRFGGATTKPLSVAQHSVMVSKYIEVAGNSREDMLWGLLHDAAEAYLGDQVTGVKHLLKDYGPLEDRILEMIIGVFGLRWPMPKCVKEWDDIIGCNEAFTFVKNGSPKFFNVEPVRKVYMTYWTPQFAEEVFLKRFDNLQSGELP
jgi:5'-nucleotidase